MINIEQIKKITNTECESVLAKERKREQKINKFFHKDKSDWNLRDDIDDVMYNFAVWIEEHPFKTMFFIQIPLAIITSLLTIVLLT